MDGDGTDSSEKDQQEAQAGCDNPDLLTTGDMARLTGNTVRTVRFYEEQGLLSPAPRTCGGHRVFCRTELAKLELVTDLREAGLAIEDIKQLFTLKAGCASARDASEKLAVSLEKQISALHQKIAVLRRLREELASTVSVVRECAGCEETQFPSSCGDCDVLEREDLPRAVKLLWGSRRR